MKLTSKTMEYQIEQYNLNISDFDDNTCRTELYPNKGCALLKERRKLYLVYYDKQVLYIGEAHTSIKTRFQRGCNAFNYYKRNNDTARNGYKGYKWLNKELNHNRNLTVTAITFSQEYDDKRETIEAIEGELVYLIRNKMGYWPKFQNEIHFSNADGAKGIAEEIMGNVFKK